MYSQAISIALNVFKDSNGYIVSTMDSNQEITSRLKFIGKLKKGDKINTRHMYVQPDGLSTCISRTFFNQDNRWNTLNFVQETIRRSFELLQLYEDSDKETDMVLFEHLSNDLKMATTGLMNLKFTYITDTKFCCDMDTLLEFIHAKLQKYEKPQDNHH